MHVEADLNRAVAPVTGGAKLLTALFRDLDAAGVELDDFGVRKPTPDDVFLKLTGHAAQEEKAAPEETSGSDGIDAGREQEERADA